MSQKVLLRVYLMDNSHKTVYVDPEETTIEELWAITSEKLGLSEESAECFFVWAVSGDVELLLYSDMTVQDVYEDWPQIEQKYGVRRTLTRTLSGKALAQSPSKINLARSPSVGVGLRGSASTKEVRASTSPPVVAPANLSKTKSGIDLRASQGVSTGLADAETDAFKFIFRPTSVMSLSTEQSLLQPEAIHLFYIQAVHHVIHSNYPCKKKSAVVMGGIQMQITLGDQKPEHIRHCMEALDEYIPEHLRDKKKPEEWVKLLAGAHLQHRGKDSVSLKRQYLDYLQRLPFYGSTFYKAKYIPSVQSFYKQDYQGTVSLGLNHVGISIIDPKLMRFETWKFQDLVFWDSVSATFVFEVITHIKQEPTRRYTFKTNQAELINDLMHDWAEEWKMQVAQNKTASPGGSVKGGRRSMSKAKGGSSGRSSPAPSPLSTRLVGVKE